MNNVWQRVITTYEDPPHPTVTFTVPGSCVDCYFQNTVKKLNDNIHM
jgi:hypothetical protein